MPMKTLTSLILLPGAVLVIASCSVVNNQSAGSFGDMAKVNRAERLLKRQDYEHAISLCNTVINKGSSEAVMRKAKLQLARVYNETRQFEKTIALYDELLYKPGKDIEVSDVITYTDLLKRTGRIGKAKEVATLYAASYSDNTRFTNIQRSLENYYSFFTRNQSDKMKVDSLQTNLPGYQYGLALYKDNLVFLSNDIKKKDAQSLYTNSKLYMISESGVAPFSNSLKGILQIGPASFFEGGKKVIYTSNRFTDVRNEKNSFINYNNGTQLLAASFQAEHNSWSRPLPVEIGKIGSAVSILHPSVAPDGKRLYFASDMPGGLGGTDIYYADWDANEKRWKAPVNLGPKVNTNGNELYPFISGEKLFFSSNGLEGFGGLDIFVINTNEPDKAPEHLPFPVNTQFDDLNPVLDDKKWLLYFTSDRSGVHDNDHIYVMSLNNDPLKDVGISNPDAPKDENLSLTVVKADDRRQETIIGDARYDNLIIKDTVQPDKPVQKAPETVVVTDSRTTIDYGNSAANSAGPEMISWQYDAGSPQAAAAKAVAAAPVAKPAPEKAVNSNPEVVAWQQHNANAATKTSTANGNATTKKPETSGLQQINGISAARLDSIMRAANMLLTVPGIIYFDLNSYIPLDQEWKKLDSIFGVWKQHPQRLILINGHADVIGDEKYNLALSKNRAVYIQECLKSRGVDADKIRINYYGSTKPVWVAGQFNIDNDRDIYIQLQGVNRRCEVKIL
ncbi:Outer membrane protein OmpA [Chitinophaga jiangningensis]|uniref:Outer membrane protein OmpA n=2 Tax=Chitinophaga jiangningensis TaxID=1419482 RepID=A0A1M6V032_9BACT|nr:Outer membrane protein OmpA [Chitinophaga jiangningensis]